jgi:hypothetical protein
MTQVKSITNLTLHDVTGMKSTECTTLERRLNPDPLHYQSLEIYSGHATTFDLCLYAENKSTLAIPEICVYPPKPAETLRQRKTLPSYASYSSMNVHGVTKVQVSKIRSVEVELKTPDGGNANVHYCSLGILSEDLALVEIVMFAKEKETLECLQVPEMTNKLF